MDSEHLREQKWDEKVWSYFSKLLSKAAQIHFSPPNTAIKDLQPGLCLVSGTFFSFEISQRTNNKVNLICLCMCMRLCICVCVLDIVWTKFGLD